MSQVELFEVKVKRSEGLPMIYVYENLPINRKINYKTAPHFFYGCKDNSTIENCYREPKFNVYGLNRTGLDYSLSHRNNHRI